MTKHKFDKTEFDNRKQAKTTLKEPHTPPTSTPALRDRVDLIEKMLGVSKTAGKAKVV